jgi:RimJ/RimL family protein N-acetyltransferase
MPLTGVHRGSLASLPVVREPIGKLSQPNLIQIKRRKCDAVHFAGQMPCLQRGAMTPANYSAHEHLRDGRPVEIRALRPDDEADMLAAIDRTSVGSLQRRFFVTKRGFSEKEKAFFMNIDFINHVALVAVIDEDGRPVIVGGSRYVVTRPGEAEVAFIVVDVYQGQGIGALLTRHLTGLARVAGLKELVADVLPENMAMRKVLGKFGFRAARSMDPQVVHLTLPLL